MDDSHDSTVRSGEAREALPAPALQRISIPSRGDLIKFKSRQSITHLFKNCLYVIEEIADEHDEAMGKLIDALPPEQQSLVVLADHLTDTRLDSIRRKILTMGNDAIRAIDEMVDGLRVNE